MSLATAARQEYIGFALEANIRSRWKDRAWYRQNRSVYQWADLERENVVALRELLRVRRQAINTQRDMERRVLEIRAAHEAAEWSESVSVGRYIYLPDVPLADAGDHFAGRS